MRKFFELVRFAKSIYINRLFGILGLIVLVLARVATECSQPLAFRSIVDGLTNHAKDFDVTLAAMKLIALLCASFSMQAGAVFLASRLEMVIRTELMYGVYEKFIRRRSKVNHSALALTHFFSDVNGLSALFPINLSLLLYNFFVMVVAFVSMWFINARLTAYVAGIFPVVAVAGYYLGRKLYRKTLPYREKFEALAKNFHEDLNGLVDTELFGSVNEKLSVIRMKVADYERLGNGIRLLSLQSSFLYIVVSSCAIIIIWGIGGNEMAKGGGTIGGLLAFANYVAMLSAPFMFILSSSSMMSNAVLSIKKMQEYKCGDREVYGFDKLNLDKGMSVECLDVDISGVNYGSGFSILEGFKFRFESGRIYAIIGESGSGKSTLLKIISGHLNLGGVSVRFNDKEVYDSSFKDKISYLQQHSFVFSDTIYQNIAMGRSFVTHDVAEEICKSIGLWDYVCSQSGGLNHIIDENGSNLSGGQRQKIHLARAFVGNPEIILLDESTSAIDVVGSKLIFEYIRKAFSDKIVIFVSHDESLLRFADSIVPIGEA